MNGQEDLPEGATVLFIILASDKTQLTVFSGDKQAWPIYLRIGNIDKRIQRCLSTRVTILIGYLPIMKLECFTEKQRSNVAYQLFHDCMESLLEPLKIVDKEGIEMTCADGWVCRVYAILTVYITNYLEQCLVFYCMGSWCP